MSHKANGRFDIQSSFQPAGDQPKAIAALVKGLKKGEREQTLLGVTGSGKTFSIAHVIAEVQKPTLVIAHNKTLAAQLAQEYRDFFPNNAVHYFVSYYDYYQPEAYVPVTDTYIEKEAMINEEIDRLRHASTQALLTRRDVIIVASVSCIYGLGSPADYEKVNMRLEIGAPLSRAELIRRLIGIYFERTNTDITPGTFRAVGNTLDVMPVNERVIYRIEWEGSTISALVKIDATTRAVIGQEQNLFIFPAKHFVSDQAKVEQAVKTISAELDERLAALQAAGKLLEAERLKRRVRYDLALIKEVGYCNGIENYSRHFSAQAPGEPPETLLSYFPHLPDGTPDFLTVIDESHVTIPQLNGMYAGDASRKNTLVEYGFRLPSAKDNRPLRFEEFNERVGQLIYVSATPGPFEREHSSTIAEQVIRPTGLIDPEVIIRPVTASTSGGSYEGQIKDFIVEAEKVIQRGERVLATTLTKKMAEDLTEYLKERGVKATYLHSDVKTIDRITLLTEFRQGIHDCIVGVNLLREGLDLPEVSLIGIFDADKEGFLRSETSLIQTIGRAARNAAGRVILYADVMTGSIERAIKETNRRRDIQKAYNTKHGITPQTIIKKINDITDHLRADHTAAVATLVALEEERFANDPQAVIAEKEKAMTEAVKILDFETAALLRDEIAVLREKIEKGQKAEAKEKKAQQARYKHSRKV
jgi:excinuclease ABC subunit B